MLIQLALAVMLSAPQAATAPPTTTKTPLELLVAGLITEEQYFVLASARPAAPAGTPAVVPNPYPAQPAPETNQEFLIYLVSAITGLFTVYTEFRTRMVSTRMKEEAKREINEDRNREGKTRYKEAALEVLQRQLSQPPYTLAVVTPQQPPQPPTTTFTES